MLNNAAIDAENNIERGAGGDREGRTYILTEIGTVLRGGRAAATFNRLPSADVEVVLYIAAGFSSIQARYLKVRPQI